MKRNASTSNQRYQTLKNYKGIKLDTQSGKYLVTKSIDGRRFYAQFDSITEAINWKNVYHPHLKPLLEDNQTLIPKKISANFEPQPMCSQNLVESNGRNREISFKDLWKLYETQHIPSLEKSTSDLWKRKVRFFEKLFSFKLCQLDFQLIDEFILKQKELAELEKYGKRFSFNSELKMLKSLFNWYRTNYDQTFINPVIPRHHLTGTIKKVRTKNKKMGPEEVVAFFNALSPFWRDFAETHFYVGGRVQEIAGLITDVVNLKDRIINIKNVIVWNQSTKKFDYLKEMPKNGEERFCHMNNKLYEIMTRRLNEIPAGCQFIFHHKGQPLTYRQIQYFYNKALKDCGLDHKYASTHIMRHSMASITRKVMGSLDYVQAVTGHKDIQMVQLYANLRSEAQIKAVNDVERYMNGLISEKMN